MAAYVFAGPQEIVLPHQKALEGAEGTLVLTPGGTYDWGAETPVGPAWWWTPARAGKKAPATPAPAPADPPAEG